ncbi:hypothetical protein DAEQUDRAFT_755923, partial [Daedalea quercina L-15889]
MLPASMLISPYWHATSTRSSSSFGSTSRMPCSRAQISRSANTTRRRRSIPRHGSRGTGTTASSTTVCRSYSRTRISTSPSASITAHMRSTTRRGRSGTGRTGRLTTARRSCSTSMRSRRTRISRRQAGQRRRALLGRRSESLRERSKVKDVSILGGSHIPVVALGYITTVRKTDANHSSWI